MSLRDYEISSQIEGKYDVPEDFYGVIMAAMRGADSFNLAKLRQAFPDTYAELRERYNSPAGLLVGETSLDGKTEHRENGIFVDGKCVVGKRSV